MIQPKLRLMNLSASQSPPEDLVQSTGFPTYEMVGILFQKPVGASYSWLHIHSPRYETLERAISCLMRYLMIWEPWKTGFLRVRVRT